jgi:drug/metabolite transporter (DMT)-like permease
MVSATQPVPSSESDRAAVAGILIMCAGVALLPFMDAVSKFLGSSLPATEIAWGRFTFQALYMLPVVLATCGLANLIPRPLGLHILRGVLHAGSNVAFIAAITAMPLASAVATVFVWPLIATALSSVALGEHVGPRRWAAVFVGLAGAVIVIRPGMGIFGLVGLLPLVTAVMYACYFIITRKLATSAPPATMHFFTGFAGSVFLGIVLLAAHIFDIELFAPLSPSSAQWGLLATVGLVSTVAHMLVILACTRAPASVLAPIGYLEIVGATAIGFFWFGDVPDFWTWVGVAVIIGSGLYVWLRERRRSRPPTVAPTT